MRGGGREEEGGRWEGEGGGVVEKVLKRVRGGGEGRGFQEEKELLLKFNKVQGHAFIFSLFFAAIFEFLQRAPLIWRSCQISSPPSAWYPQSPLQEESPAKPHPPEQAKAEYGQGGEPARQLGGA